MANEGHRRDGRPTEEKGGGLRCELGFLHDEVGLRSGFESPDLDRPRSSLFKLIRKEKTRSWV